MVGFDVDWHLLSHACALACVFIALEMLPGLSEYILVPY